MKNKTTITLTIIGFFIINLASAQVGIGTNAPEGILDVNSTDMGFVYPSASLTSTQVQAPVVNPRGGVLAVGTTIFNRNETFSGANDVEPGIYSWDGTQWITHFNKTENTLFEQTATLRTASILPYVNVTMSGNIFTPKYTGIYKMELRGYYGAGRVVTSNGMHTVMGEGNFRLTFNGDSSTIDAKSYSSYHPDVPGLSHYFNVWKEVILIKYVSVTAGIPYAFSLEFDQTTTQTIEGFQGLGNTGNGMGYVGSEVPCRIEFTYLDN